MRFKFFPTLAALVTSLGVVGLVVSSLAHASVAGDFFFNAAAACMVVGPLIFFAYVIVGLCMEFVATNQKFGVKITALARPLTPSLVPASHVAFEQWIPEGLRRERKGPLNPSTGRGSKMS